MLSHDAATNTKAKAGATIAFGGEKRLEDARHDLAGNAIAVVVDLDAYHGGLIAHFIHCGTEWIGHDADADATSLMGCIERIAEQVQEHLDQLVAVDVGNRTIV